jgi:hypothetical protein
VVVLRDAAGSRTKEVGCTLHCLRGGRYLARLGGVDGAPGLIERIYFAGRADSPPQAGDPDETGVDIDWQLVSSFLRKHRDDVNVLDVDECASASEAAARLRVLVSAALSGPGRTVAR